MDGIFESYENLSQLEEREAMRINLAYFEMLRKFDDAIILRVTKMNGTVFTLRLKKTHDIKVLNNGLVRTVKLRKP